MRSVIAALLCLAGSAASAQTPTGYVSVTGDFLPDRDRAAELRSRLFAEEVLDPTPRLVMTASGFIETLVAKRGRARTDAIARVEEATVDYRADRLDVFAGFGTVAWGRLDELQPTDVVNPLDVSRFFFDGRSEARLPVGLARVRWHFSENAAVEGVYVPFFRKGRFDQLDERTSPFTLATATSSPPDIQLPPGLGAVGFRVSDRAPSVSLGSAQGGVRFSATGGRVDWSVSAYRGIKSFGVYEARGQSPATPDLLVDVVYPRFTMIGGDVETVRGGWGMRGEVAAFVDDTFQSGALGASPGTSFDAGVGVDRKAGSYRVSATALVHRESFDSPLPGGGRRTDASFIGSVDRSFGRERYRLRGFAVVNPAEGSGFLRAIATMKVSDALAVDASGGWFAGSGRDLIGRFATSDFAYLRLKYYFQ